MRPATWRVVTWLLSRYLPPERRSAAFGDLLEEYDERLIADGRARTEIWLLREAVSFAGAYRRPPGRAPGAWSRVRLATDLRHAWRSLRARPAATLAVVTVLALGIGVVSAMFALADPYILRPLPYANPDELITMSVRTMSPADVPTLADLNRRTDVVSAVMVHASPADALVVAAGGGEVTLHLAPVSRNFFAGLGVGPLLPESWQPPSDAAAEMPIVLTRTAARRLFGTADAVGTLVRDAAGGRLGYRVTAVVRDFVDPARVPGRTQDGYTPWGDGRVLDIRLTRGGYAASGPSLFARMRPGVTARMVEGALTTGQAARPNWPPESGIVVVAAPLRDRLTRQSHAFALGVLSAGVLILLVCAANVANLLLARGVWRVREFAVREALGASRLDVARLVLVELGCLVVAGVACALAVTKVTLALLLVVVPERYVSLGTPTLTSRVVLAACAAGGLVMSAGLFPALAAWRSSRIEREGRPLASETMRARGMRVVMTSAQTAVAIVLLAGAVLFGRSYINLMAQDPGYEGDTLALAVTYPGSPTVMTPMLDATAARLRTLPGVSAVGVTQGSMVDGVRVGIGGRMAVDGKAIPGAPRRASLEFFDALGSRLVAGRFWNASDYPRVAVVTQALADACCEGRPPLGSVVTYGNGAFEIVGVVQDIYADALDSRPAPVAFVSLSAEGAPAMGWVNYVLRAEAPDPDLAGRAARIVRSVAPGIVVRNDQPLGERLMRSVDARSFATLIAVLFATAAVGVSGAGIAGVVGFLAARRTREIAIRMAIGATAPSVTWLVVGEAALATAAGVCVGTLGAVWASKLVANLVYGIEPADPASFVVAALAMALLVAVAAWFPARRALQLSPSDALRAE